MADLKVSTLDNAIDPTAEPGTTPWINAVAEQAKSYLKEYTSDARLVGKSLAALKGFEAWAKKGFASWDLFCLSEIGISEVTAEGFISAPPGSLVGEIRKAGPAREHGGDRKSEEAKADQGDPVTLKRKRGNNSTYLGRRLLRDRPELLGAVERGEHSIKSAAVEAGFVKATITIPRDPEGAARAIKRRFTPEQIDEIVELLRT